MSDARRAGHRGALITADACARLDPQVKYEMTEEVISCFAPDCLLQSERVKGVVWGGGGVRQIPPPPCNYADGSKWTEDQPNCAAVIKT